MRHGFVGFSPQYGGVYTYYFHDDKVEEVLKHLENELSPDYIEQVNRMSLFWAKENTLCKVKERYYQKYPMKDDIRASYYYNACRIAGMNVDLDLLVHTGLNGLKKRVQSYRTANGASTFYDALEQSIDVISEACLLYANKARVQIRTASMKRKAQLEEIICTLEHIAVEAPRTFKEALQLMWIYSVCSDLMNFGRMDHYLGDFYARDIDSGRLTEDEAIDYLSSLFRNIIKINKIHDSRIIIGGLGRKDVQAADRLALVLIKVARMVKDVVPQLTLRYYDGICEKLVDEALINIQEGAVYPILYSDDAIVPSIEKIYAVDHQMACRWVPFGCGEYVIEGYGTATPNTGAIISTALDVVLHRGINSFSGIREAEDCGDPAEFETFEDLFRAYESILKPVCESMAYHEQLNYEVAGEEACYLHLSLLIHDCVETNQPIFSGGCRFLTATSEVFGLITCADSLMAIKHCVYDNKIFTLPQIVKMCDANFVGYEKERSILQGAPKYGNDDDEADNMAIRVFNHIADLHEEAGAHTNLYRYKVVSVNNSGSSERGERTAATPCGRKKGDALSNGNSPSLGADKNGLTATLNSMAKIDPLRHVGVVHNIRFNKELLKNNTDKIKMVLKTFYENNGIQTNLSCVGKEDLEQALLFPERYKNLIVRIGGFSARYVELSKVIQQEILLRTTYEEL
jgi:pyruvate-formate lyase